MTATVGYRLSLPHNHLLALHVFLPYFTLFFLAIFITTLYVLPKLKLHLHEFESEFESEAWVWIWVWNRADNHWSSAIIALDSHLSSHLLLRPHTSAKLLNLNICFTDHASKVDTIYGPDLWLRKEGPQAAPCCSQEAHSPACYRAKHLLRHNLPSQCQCFPVWSRSLPPEGKIWNGFWKYHISTGAVDAP